MKEMAELMVIRPPITLNSFKPERLQENVGIEGDARPNYIQSWAARDLEVFGKRWRLELPSIRPAIKIGGIEGTEEIEEIIFLQALPASRN